MPKKTLLDCENEITDSQCLGSNQRLDPQAICGDGTISFAKVDHLVAACELLLNLDGNAGVWQNQWLKPANLASLLVDDFGSS